MKEGSASKIAHSMLSWVSLNVDNTIKSIDRVAITSKPNVTTGYS